MGPTGATSLAKVLSRAAALLSTVALVIASVGTDWLFLILASVAVLVFFGAVHTASSAAATGYGERIAARTAWLARSMAWMFNPLLTAQSTLLRHRASDDPSDPASDLVATEIELPADSVGEPLDEREVRMIQGVVQQDKTMAREIMVPRVDIVAAEMGTTIAKLTEQMVAGGHSRVPVFSGDLDHIEGIAYVRDILEHVVRRDATSLLDETLVRPALFIPESKTLEELLQEFQEKRVHLAIVIDEYGGVSGLVTIEDLLEEIVGEIQDEFDVGEPEIEAVDQNHYIMDARVSIDELNELLSVSVEGDGFDTLGGFVYERLGKIASPGDRVEYDGIVIEVVTTTGRRLKKLRVTKSAGL
jgi:CBS domain containing-hemolysin-like protein